MKIDKLFCTMCFLILVSLLLVSCYDNCIYFDMNDQTVRTCNKQAISNLYISGLNNNDFYHFYKMPDKKGTNEFSLERPNRNYILEGMFDLVLPLDSFKLQPNTEYEIVNSTFGDATAGRFVIKTGTNGAVVYASETSCK